MSAQVYKDGFVHVRSEQCEHCLLSAGRLVNGVRARELVDATRRRDGASFVCHLGQISTEQEAICKGWWDNFSDEDWIMRLAVHLDKIKFV